MKYGLNKIKGKTDINSYLTECAHEKKKPELKWI